MVFLVGEHDASCNSVEVEELRMRCDERGVEVYSCITSLAGAVNRYQRSVGWCNCDLYLPGNHAGMWCVCLRSDSAGRNMTRHFSSIFIRL